jgi:hypothetical protein
MLDLIKNEEYDKIINYFEKINLETFTETNHLSKLLIELERKNDFMRINKILMIIADYKINTLIYELKDGIRLLTINK